MPQALPLPQAVIFDCDGTLINTEEIALAALEDELAVYGYQLSSDDQRAILGRSFFDVHRHLSGRVGLPSAGEFEDACVAREFDLMGQAEPFQDALDALAVLRDAGVKLAVASSSPRKLLDAALARVTPDVRFAVSVAAEDVPVGKPAPYAYIISALLLGVDPRRCVAVEDSPVGVRAALSSGMTVVGVERKHACLQEATVRCREVSLEAVSEAWGRRQFPADNPVGAETSP